MHPAWFILAFYAAPYHSGAVEDYARASEVTYESEADCLAAIPGLAVKAKAPAGTGFVCLRGLIVDHR